MANSSGVSASTSSPVMNCLSHINSTSDNGLRRDAAKEPMDIAIKQLAVAEVISAKVKTVSKAKNYKKISVENETDKIIFEAENFKSEIEVESNKAVEAKNNKTTVEAGNNKGSGKLKDNKIPQVNTHTDTFSSLSEHITALVMTNPATVSLSENSAVNIAKDFATITGNSAKSECHTVVTDSHLSVCAVQSEPKDKNMDTTLPPDALYLPSLSSVPELNILLATCDSGVSVPQEVCTQSANVRTVVTDTEAGLDGVKVKQEQPSEYDSADLSVFAMNGEERLQQTEDVKMDPEVMLINMFNVTI
jgi:hypothetical protein